MLTSYATAVGLHPWEESFYHNPSYLITNRTRTSYSYTLAQARTRLGLTN